MAEEFFIPIVSNGFPNLGEAIGLAADCPVAGEGTANPPGELIFVRTQNAELQVEVERTRAERDRLTARERVIMDLLGTSSADRILHDLRNVLNERSLYRALVDVEGSAR